jgi:hypothetical protein
MVIEGNCEDPQRNRALPFASKLTEQEFGWYNNSWEFRQKMIGFWAAPNLQIREINWVLGTNYNLGTTHKRERERERERDEESASLTNLSWWGIPNKTWIRTSNLEPQLAVSALQWSIFTSCNYPIIAHDHDMSLSSLINPTSLMEQSIQVWQWLRAASSHSSLSARLLAFPDI